MKKTDPKKPSGGASTGKATAGGKNNKNQKEPEPEIE